MPQLSLAAGDLHFNPNMTVWNIFQAEFSRGELESLPGTMRDDLYSEEHRKLRKILRRERIAAGLRQSDVAEKTNRSQAYISKFEKGDLRLDVVDFVRICDVIGCNVVDVMAETFSRQKVVKIGVSPGADVQIELRPSPLDIGLGTVLVADESSAEPLGTHSISNRDRNER